MNPAAVASLFTNDQPHLQAALVALNQLPSPEPVPAVSMNAEGRLLIVGEAEVAVGWAERLAGQRTVTVLATEGTAEVPDEADFALEFGSELGLSGHLGAFELTWATPVGMKQGCFDVVLDLSPNALLNRVELPPGYVAPGRDTLDQALAVIDLLV